MEMENKKNDPKHAFKDGIFKSIFSEKKAFIDIYKNMSGKELKEEEISIFDLKTDVVSRQRYNDVSFITKDGKAIIMMEHQSSINGNMAARMLLYYADLLQLYLNQENKNLNGSKNIKIPKPELYVAYNGKKELKEIEQRLDCEFLSIKVKIIDIKLEKLENLSNESMLAGYSTFMDKMEKEKEKGKNIKEAFENAREYCKKTGHLKGIIEKEEFAMLASVMSYDGQLREEGREEGIEIGIEIGIEKGIEKERQRSQKLIEQERQMAEQGMQRGMQQGSKKAIYETAKSTLLETHNKELSKSITLGVAKASGISEKTANEIFEKAVNELSKAKELSKITQIKKNLDEQRTPEKDFARMKPKVDAQNKPQQNNKNKGLDR